MQSYRYLFSNIIATGILLIGVVAPVTSYAQTLPHQDLADNILTDYFARVEGRSDAHQQIDTVQQKIATYLDRNLSVNIRLILSYIDQELEMFQNRLNTPPSIITDNEPLQDATQDETDQTEEQVTTNIDAYFEGPKTIVAGEESTPVIELTYTARLEDLVIENMEISSAQHLGELFSAIRFYDQDGELLSSWNIVGDNAMLNNIDLYIPQDTTRFYVTLEPHNVGRNQIGKQLETVRLTFSPTKAVGQITKDEVPVSTRDQTSDKITIAPVKLANVALVDEAVGYRVDTRLYNGDVDMAIIKLTADKRSNTLTTSTQELHLLLNKIDVRVEDSTAAGNIANNLLIERIDKGSSSLPATATGDGASFDLTAAPATVRTLDPGDTAYFLIHGPVTLSSATVESIKIVLDDLDSGGITYQSHDASAQPVTSLGINTTVLEGPAITE